jgi:DNA-binding protein HU-beta
MVSKEKGGNGMTKADLVAKMAKEASITKAAAERALRCVTDSIQDCVNRRERIALPGLGSFSTSKRKARIGRNPRTGQTINIPAKTVAKFSPAKELVQAAR